MDGDDPSPASAGRGSPRVLFLSSHAQLGGSEQVLQDLVTALPAPVVAGVVCLEPGPFVARLAATGVVPHVLPVGASRAALVRAAVRLRRLVRRSRADVLHANGVKAAAVAVLACTGLPVVWMKHDIYRDGGLSRLLARRCAAVACVSAEVARDVLGSGRTSVVHPGVVVDADRARADAVRLRESLGLSRPVVSVVGRLDPAKGHAELVEVLPELRRAVPGVTALLVGGDDPQHPGHRQVLLGRARELGVQSCTVLPGHLPAAAVLAASDVVCVPTVPDQDGRGREGFGLVAAEAMALGVPVVAYDVGATAEVLGACGVLVPAGDRRALCLKVAQSVHDEVLRQAWESCARSRAAELTPARTADRLLRIYRGVHR